MNASVRVENVAVKIMGREYVFACAPEERASLLECVARVDAKMNAIKSMGKLSAIDRIAVMAALTIASESMAPAASAFSSDVKSALENAPTAHRMESLSEEIRRFLEDVGARISGESRDLFSM